MNVPLGKYLNQDHVDGSFQVVEDYWIECFPNSWLQAIPTSPTVFSMVDGKTSENIIFQKNVEDNYTEKF